MRCIRSIGLLVCVAVQNCVFSACLQISVGRQEALFCLSHQRHAESLMYGWPPAAPARETRDTNRCSVCAIGILVIYVRCPRHSPHTPTHTHTSNFISQDVGSQTVAAQSFRRHDTRNKINKQTNKNRRKEKLKSLPENPAYNCVFEPEKIQLFEESESWHPHSVPLGEIQT